MNTNYFYQVTFKNGNTAAPDKPQSAPEKPLSAAPHGEDNITNWSVQISKNFICWTCWSQLESTSNRYYQMNQFWRFFIPPFSVRFLSWTIIFVLSFFTSFGMSIKADNFRPYNNVNVAVTSAPRNKHDQRRIRVLYVHY